MKINAKMMMTAVLTAAMCVSLTGCGEKSFNVTDTLEVHFDGYNGYGVCELENEYAWVNDVNDWYGKNIDDVQRAANEVRLMDTVTYEITPSEGLSNGDSVTIKANIGSAAEEFAFLLKGEEITAIVEGLEEVEMFDPFEDVTVSFEGIAPDGKVNVQLDEGIGDIKYQVSQESGLSNGDVITITLEPKEGMNAYAERYGRAFSTTEMTYTVEGLTSYATTLDSIPEDMMKKMEQQAEDSLRASAASWAEGNSIKEITLLGHYFLNRKDGFSVNPQNELYLVYEITANVTGLKRGGDGETMETAEETYYTYCRFSDILLLPDGTCSLDLSASELCNNQIESDYGYNNFWVGATFYTYKGFKDLDSMFNHCVTTKIESYQYESTVK